MNKFLKYALFLVIAAITMTFTACSDDDDVDNTIVLGCPKPVQSSTLGKTVTFKWDAISKAAGYACRVISEDGYESEWEDVESGTTIYTTPKLENGHYTLEAYAVGDYKHTTDSKVRQVEFDVEFDGKLVAPEVIVSVSGKLATFSWSAVEGCLGYSYKINDGEWIDVDASVLSVSVDELADGNYTFSFMVRGDNLFDTIDSDVVTYDFLVESFDPNVGVVLKRATGDMSKMTETSTGVYSSTFAVRANETFKVLIDGVEYGWMRYSGNGCVGYLNSVYSTVAYSSVPDFYKTFYVEQSVGRMASTDGESFYSNLDAAGTVTLTVDRSFSDGTPRYWLKLNKTLDSSVLLEQRFDLFVWGGDWSLGNESKYRLISSTTYSDSYEGTEPTSADLTGTYTNSGTAESTWSTSSLYTKYRDVLGWEAEHAMEHPGYVRINGKGKILTPQLSALTSTSNIVVEFDMLRFSNNGTNTFSVVGGGTVSAVSYANDGATTSESASVTAGSSTFDITSTIGSAYNAGTDKTGRKKWTHVTIEITGATASTQVGIVDVTTTSRICLDNFVIKRK
jgi:hypothetical protein